MLTALIGKPIVDVAAAPEPVLSLGEAAILTVGADEYPLPLDPIEIVASDLPQNTVSVA